MTDLLCSILGFITNLITKFFPEISIGSGNLSTITSAFASMIEFIAQINFIVPLPTIFTILSIVYGIKAAKFTLFLVNWVIRRIRGG